MLDYLKTPIKDLSLPKLSYDYSALIPAISERIMILHHDKHHNGYFTKLVAGVESSEEVSNMTLLDAFAKLSSLPDSVQKAVQNNGGGFYNHALFWEVLTPDYEDPSSALSEKISSSFGSIKDFKEQLTAAAMGVFGSGWAWLVVNDSGNLKITTTSNQDNPLMDIAAQTGTPVFGVDVWEHAYYLDYENRRDAYLENIWKVVNWKAIEEKLS